MAFGVPTHGAKSPMAIGNGFGRFTGNLRAVVPGPCGGVARSVDSRFVFSARGSKLDRNGGRSARDAFVYSPVAEEELGGDQHPAQEQCSARSTSRTSKSSAYEDSEEEDFSPPSGVQCCASVLGEWKSRVAKANVRNLRRSYFLGALALWHSYGIWTAACINVATGLVLLVRWYVGWLRFSISECGTGNSPFAASCSMHFFATFLRSYLLISLISEISRFCFWLGRDAWRDDAFEAYRRTLLGQAQAEMELGVIYAVGWSSKMLVTPIRYADALLQCVIYFSFDALPVICGVVAYSQDGATPGSAASAAFQVLAAVSVIHVLTFYAAWLITDVKLKVDGFKKALECDCNFLQNAEEILAEYMREEAQQAACQGDEKDALLLESSLSIHTSHALRRFATSVVPVGKNVKQAPEVRRSVADQLSLCAPLRVLLHLTAPHLPWPVLLIFGLFSGHTGLLGASFLLLIGSLFYSYGKTNHAKKRLSDLPPFCETEAEFLWSIQSWGETCCGLNHDEQLKRRVAFAKIVLLQIILFIIFRWWSYVLLCVILLLVTMAKQTLLFVERPWGWLSGIVEGLLLAVFIAGLSYAFPTTSRWNSGIPSIGLLALSAARQFGLARENPDCYRLMHATSLMLTLATLLIVGVVLYSSVTYNSSMDYTKGTSFCHPEDPACQYYSVPYLPPNETHSLTCPAWFSVGSKGMKFSLSDFGLLAWIAYEPRQTMLLALRHYFPDWTILHFHWAASEFDDRGSETEMQHQDGARQVDNDDWTTFFEYASSDNRTSVLSIRGTHNAIDALNDIVLWTPAVVFQAFSLFGPDAVPPAQVAMSSILNFFEGSHNYEKFFGDLLAYVERRKAEEPEREFFVTGHSLGGGLAKLVAAKSGLRAVTFMAPGLSTTSHVVYRKFHGDLLRGGEVLTLQPQYDIVSRLDDQTGLVVPIECSRASGLYCHLIGPALCEIFGKCGSGRGGVSLSLPCGVCDQMPCPSDGPAASPWPWPVVKRKNQKK